MTVEARPGRNACTSLGDFVRCYEQALPREFCDRLIDAFRQSSAIHVQREREWRPGLDASAWTELDLTPLADAALKGFFRDHVAEYLARYNSDVGLRIAIPASPMLAELRLKRYQPGTGQEFQLHFDSINAVANRYLVFLWYLNDVSDGGETEFPDLGIKVQPRAGRLLMFPPYWMYQHAGLPPRSGEKFILSTYLLFPRMD
jgi:2-oxoglutarate-Fe(II)-dependent oxygenase superfamily protein